MPDAPSDASGSPARPRGRRWRIALVLVAIAVLAAFGLLSGLDGWVQQTLQRMVVHELAGELSFGQFRLDLWRMQASFSDLRLRIPRGNDGSLRIHIRRGHARLKVSSLLGFAAGQARLSELRLEQPHLEWERASGGTEQVRGDLQPRAIDLRIEHMEVLDGRLLYSEHSPPWSFDASEVSLEAAWSHAARALVGDASLRLEVRRPPFVRPLALSIRSGFELRRHDVALEELVVQGPGLTATLSSNIRLFAPLAAVGHGRVDIDLEQLHPLLDPELPTLAGRLAGPVSLDWGAGQVGLRGRLEAEDPRFGILAADAARAIYRYANGKLEVVEFEAQAYDGTVSGTFETRFGEAAEFQARVEGRAVDATALLAAFDVPLPLQSLVDFELSLAGAAGQRSDWRATTWLLVII